jgi:tetratricopeptide (TPR) repeat protein
MSSVALVMLLGFDYDTFRKHIFHVYPLPAYAICALWIGLGFDWLLERYRLARPQALAAAGGAAGVMLAAGAYVNLTADHAWAARYAQTVLGLVPKDAIVFGQGDADLAPMAYYHMIEERRPDITLYQPKGLVLGNRLFHPLRTHPEHADKLLAEMIDRQRDPVVFTLDAYSGYAQRDRFLYIEVDKSSRDPKQVTIDIPEEAMRFFEEAVAEASSSNAWTAFFQSVLRRRYGLLLAQTLPKGQPNDERSRRHYELLAGDFYGALGIAEGMMLNKSGFAAGAVVAYLDRARDLLPPDAPKEHVARYFALRGAMRATMQEKEAAIRDLELSLSLWPTPDNAAIEPLENLYRETGDEAALKALQERLQRIKRMRRL